MQTTQQRTPTTLEQLVRDVVTEALPHLEYGIDYTTSQILPAELWASLKVGAHISIGQTLSRLVERGRVPLVRTSPPYKMPVTYQRI